MHLRSIRAALAVLAVTTLASCKSEGATNPPDPQLRTYDIPAGYGPEIKGVLNNALDTGEKNPPIARVALSPNGKLVVVGPEGIQTGVRDLLDQLAKAPPAAPPPTIGFTYWLVIGKRSKEAGAIPADLNDVAPALQSIQKADGPLTFSTFERLGLLSQSNEFGEQKSGRGSYVRQRATIHDKKVIADLNLENGRQKVETRVELAPGQLLVLGQSGWAGSGQGPAPEDSTLYWIARADVK